MILNISITLPDDADIAETMSAIRLASRRCGESLVKNHVLEVDEMRELDDGFGETICTFFRSE